MPKPVLLVVHQKTSDPGRIGLRLRTLGWPIEICRHACGDPLPESMDDYAGAVIFGGPMSANDDHETFIRNELDWTPKVIESGAPFLGVCLGAQIMARAWGGRVESHPEGLVEIGFYPVRATTAGAGIFPEEMWIFQWHREGFSVPDGARLLAAGETYLNQAIGIGANAIGIQFHPEVTEQMNRRWLSSGAKRLRLPGAQGPEQHMQARARHDRVVHDWTGEFLGKWLATDRR